MLAPCCPRPRPRADGALDAALDRLGGHDLDRPDTPDLHVTAVRRLPAVAAQLAPFPEALDEPARHRRCRSRGIEQLYTHQAEAIEHALAGRHTVVITPTASGKTLCYNAPVLHAILQDPSSRALYLFPTKALAQDQLAELQAMCEAIDRDAGEQIGVFTYDGDTPQDARRTIRSRAHLVLSNPDMVHSGILPHHPRWAKLFENLRYVIIDELHAYRGVFGSHLCNVLRRLRRICRHYGSNPVFLCSSATIANPRELAERLTEQPFELVDRSGAPRGEKFFVFVNPPVVNHQLGIRRSYLERDAARRVGVPQAEPAADRVRAEPPLDRNPDDVSEGRFRGDSRRARSGSAATAAAICRCGAARSRKGCAKGRCARSCRPTRSSSASTSARSTCR